MPKSLNSPRHVVLRDALIAQRKAAGMTQTQVAAVLGHPQSYIAKVEGGERRIDVVELVDLAEVIGLDLLKLMQALQDAR